MTVISEWLTAHADLPRLEAELLLTRVLGASRSQLVAHPQRCLKTSQLADLTGLATRLRAGEPYAYITGEREFWSLALKVNPSVLIPRPETELLVEAALARLTPDSRVLDLGTGSGAVAIAIAAHLQSLHAREAGADQVSAVDSSDAALAVARDNAARHDVKISFARSDWFESVSGTFHIVVSNPPYVAAGDPHLDKLAHEPRTALVSGPDGLLDLTRICRAARPYITPGGWLLLEHGADQGAGVRRLLTEGGFDQVQTLRDLAGLERVTLGSRTP